MMMNRSLLLMLLGAIVIGTVVLRADARRADERSVTVLLMADTHAALDVHPEIFFDHTGQPTFRPAGGYALLASAIQKQRVAASNDAVLVNVGDTIHGSAVAEWTQGAGIVPVVNALGIDVFVPGNWEFAYGPDVFRQRMRELNHPVTAINLFDKVSGSRLFARSFVKEVGGVKVAVVGLTAVIVDTSMAPAFSTGLRFTFKEDLQAEVDRLRREGVQIVLLGTELGLAQEIRLAREIKDVDFILGAHTHERTASPIVEGRTPVIQAGSEGSFPRADCLPCARRPGRRLRPYIARGHTGAQIGLTNGFRFSYPVPPGPITEEDLFNVFPMDAAIKVGTLSGQQLKDFWEEGLDQVFTADAYGQRGGWGPRASGMTVRVRLGVPKGQRVIEMRVAGVTVVDHNQYTVASCDRPVDPAHRLCRFDGASNTRTLSLTIQQALRQYLKAHPVIRPETEGRIVAEDAGGRTWSQHELAQGAAERTPRD